MKSDRHSILILVIQPEIYDLQKESYPKKFQDGSDSD